MFLEVENLQAGYGTEEVLHGVSLRVDEGEIVSILGANGAGKTTTLLTISGLVRASGGAVRFQGEDLHTLPSHEVVRRGLTQSPEGRRVFGVLSVLENLRLGAFTVGDKEKAEQTLDWIFDLFPRLHERKDQLAGTLSGGEQQMLAIGRALMGQPKLLLLDEPSLGLAPLLVKSIFETIRAINQSSRKIDKATDVLSFPMFNLTPGVLPESWEEYEDPGTGLVPLGDMAISLERAEQQAKEFGHSTKREVGYLTIHSVLHLLGYDHMDEGEMKRQMREREEAILAEIELTR